MTAAIRYYTRRQDVPLGPGQVVHFTKGKGYYAYPTLPTPPKTVLTIGLTADKTGAVVKTMPAGTVEIEWARTSAPTSADPDYFDFTDLTATFLGTAAKPYVDALAKDGSGQPIGTWTGRIETTQPVAPPPPPPVTGTARIGLDNNVEGDPNGAGGQVIAIKAKVIREDSDAVIRSGWAKAHGVQVGQIIYPGDIPNPGALWHEVVANSRNEPYWAPNLDPVAWAVGCLAEVERVQGYGFDVPIIIPAVAYGAGAGNNGMDGILYPGEFAYPISQSVYMNGHKPWVKTINAAAPALLPAVRKSKGGLSVHPYYDPKPFHVLDVVRQHLADIGFGDLPFYCTEFGMYSSVDHSGDAHQAVVVKAELAAMLARPDVVAATFYRGGADSEGSASWGVWNADGSPRPAEALLAAAIAASP